LDRAQQVRLGTKQFERILPRHDFDLAVSKNRSPAFPRQINSPAGNRCYNADARMRDQALVQFCPSLIATNLLEREPLLGVGEIHQSETRAVGDHHIVGTINAILLWKNDFAQSVSASEPITKPA